tara:strand:- start:152 stop:700 length:549 start_codon:yes stop_codon:yes gene_type:complete
MNSIVILLISLFIYISCSYCKEGFINKPYKDKPDDLQFHACHDYSSNQNLGNNNYKLKRHGVVEPQQGAYSSFLDIYKLRNYDEIFHSPICESEYNFKDIQNLKTPEILEYRDALNEKSMLKLEEEYERNSIKDPYYSYVSPQFIGNKLTYSDNAIKMFLNTHHSQKDDNGSSHRSGEDYTN